MSWVNKLINLGPLNGWKTVLAAALYNLAKYVPGFPVIDLGQGVTPDQALLILAAVKKLLEKLRR